MRSLVVALFSLILWSAPTGANGAGACPLISFQNFRSQWNSEAARSHLEGEWLFPEKQLSAPSTVTRMLDGPRLGLIVSIDAAGCVTSAGIRSATDDKAIVMGALVAWVKLAKVLSRSANAGKEVIEKLGLDRPFPSTSTVLVERVEYQFKDVDGVAILTASTPQKGVEAVPGLMREPRKLPPIREAEGSNDASPALNSFAAAKGGEWASYVVEDRNQNVTSTRPLRYLASLSGGSLKLEKTSNIIATPWEDIGGTFDVARSPTIAELMSVPKSRPLDVKLVEKATRIAGGRTFSCTRVQFSYRSRGMREPWDFDVWFSDAVPPPSIVYATASGNDGGMVSSTMTIAAFGRNRNLAWKAALDKSRQEP